MRRRVVVTMAFAICSLGSGGAQGRVPFENVAGPWERTGPNGIDGIFVQILGSAQLRVYHRTPDGSETWGWYLPDLSGGSETLDGAHLQVGSLDLRFDYSRQTWSGAWSATPRQAGATQVELARPRARASAANPLAGLWNSVSEERRAPLVSPARLHVAESTDGRFTAWLDTDTTFGELLDVRSVNAGVLVLETTNATGVSYQYKGTLTADSATLTGAWTSTLPSGPMTSRPGTFTRAQP